MPITAIAVSTGQNDSGLFELNFRDERYLPFEGAGVISKWRLELPADFRQFDYQTITDVIVQLRYTAINGGDKLAAIAAKSVQSAIKSVENLSRDEGLFAAFDLRHEFPDEWYKATRTTPGSVDPGGPGRPAAVLHPRPRPGQNPGHRHLPVHHRHTGTHRRHRHPRLATTPHWAPAGPSDTLTTFDATGVRSARSTPGN